jgi:hypothetical protein
MSQPGVIRPNPGGTLPVDQIIGRDAELELLMERLSAQSVALVGLRRMGKTSLCHLLRARWGPERCFYVDLEGLSSPARALERVHDAVKSRLGPASQALSWRNSQDRLISKGKVAGVELELKEPDWALWLDSLAADLGGQKEAPMVLILDEITVFVDGLIQRHREQEAMVFLDRLRAARQQHPGLRMVLTGSIGLQESVDQLHARGHANNPINDLHMMDLGCLSSAAAVQLARSLLSQLPGDAASIEDLAPHLAKTSEGHPYVLQHLALELHRAGRPATRHQVDEALSALLLNGQDPLQLYSYLSRLERYHSPADMEAVKLLLDAVALQPGQTGAQLRERLSHLPDEQLRKLLRQLRRDHYLQRLEDSRWSFALQIFLRWWKLEREL